MSTGKLQQQTEGPDTKNEKLVERIPMAGTPFTMVYYRDQWMITLGDYVLAKEFETSTDAEEYLEKDMWNVIAGMVWSLVDAQIKMNKPAKTKKK